MGMIFQVPGQSVTSEDVSCLNRPSFLLVDHTFDVPE